MPINIDIWDFACLIVNFAYSWVNLLLWFFRHGFSFYEYTYSNYSRLWLTVFARFTCASLMAAWIDVIDVFPGVYLDVYLAQWNTSLLTISKQFNTMHLRVTRHKASVNSAWKNLWLFEVNTQTHTHTQHYSKQRSSHYDANFARRTFNKIGMSCRRQPDVFTHTTAFRILHINNLLDELFVYRWNTLIQSKDWFGNIISNYYFFNCFQILIWIHKMQKKNSIRMRR